MKAVVLNQFGDIKDLEKNLTIKEIPQPEINEDEVLINIKFASLNHRDLWITKGMYSKITFPIVLGSDGAGIIYSKGRNVTNFEIGDEVIVNPSLNWGDDENFQSKEFKILGMPDNGTFAEFLKINKSYVYQKPSGLNLSQSAAFPLVGLTAFRALFKKAKIHKDDNLLITGIGGGVSSITLSFALKLGANVYVTSGNNSKIERAILLGAKAGVNYNNDNWHKEIMEASDNKINIIVDGTGGETLARCMDVCNYGGTIVSYGATRGSIPQFGIHQLYWKQIKMFGSTMGSQNDFSHMIKFINDYSVTPFIDRVFPLDDIHQAFRKMNDSKQFGKLIIEI